MARGCRSAEFVSSYDRQPDRQTYSQDEKTRIARLSPARPILTVSRLTGFT